MQWGGDGAPAGGGDALCKNNHGKSIWATTA